MKLAVLDKDGTLTTPKSGNTFVQNPTDQILMVGVVEGCQRLIDAGYILAIASNQGGVEGGHKTLEDAIKEMHYCVYLLEKFHINIKTGVLCPDFKGNQCIVVNNDTSFDYISDSIVGYKHEDLIGFFRKPQPGMLKAIASFHEMPKAKTRNSNPFKTELKIEHCWMIGDREEDRLAAEAAGFNFLDADEWRKGASPFIDQTNLTAAIDMRFANLDSIESELLESALDGI